MQNVGRRREKQEQKRVCVSSGSGRVVYAKRKVCVMVGSKLQQKQCAAWECCCPGMVGSAQARAGARAVAQAESHCSRAGTADACNKPTTDQKTLCRNNRNHRECERENPGARQVVVKERYRWQVVAGSGSSGSSGGKYI